MHPLLCGARMYGDSLAFAWASESLHTLKSKLHDYKYSKPWEFFESGITGHAGIPNQQGSATLTCAGLRE